MRHECAAPAVTALALELTGRLQHRLFGRPAEQSPQQAALSVAVAACGKSPQTEELPAARTLEAAPGAASCVMAGGSFHCTELGAPKQRMAVCGTGTLEYVLRVKGRSMHTVSTPRSPAKARGWMGTAGAIGAVSRNHCGSPSSISIQHSLGVTAARYGLVG
jgi:hypothetical protein